MALFELGEHVVGDRLALRRAVLDRQPVDRAELHLARPDLVRQQVPEHPRGLVRDDGADAVAPAHADDDGVELPVVGKLLLRLNALIARELRFHERRELFSGGFDFLVQSRFSHIFISPARSHAGRSVYI